MKDRRLNSGSDSRPIIGSDFGANITSQYRPVIIIQASIDHRSNIDSQPWLPTLRAWADHRPDRIFLHGLAIQLNFYNEIKYYFEIQYQNYGSYSEYTHGFRFVDYEQTEKPK